MSEATNEQLEFQELTDEQREQFEEQQAQWRRRGIIPTRALVTEFIRALRQQRPVAEEGSAGSEARRRDIATGRSTVDYVPPGLKAEIEADAPLDRQYTKIEQQILEYQKEAKLEGKEFNEPPGKKLDFLDKHAGTHKIEWAKYGWADAEKNAVESVFAGKFTMTGRQRTLAMEVLLLHGYTAAEVNTKLQGVDRYLRDVDRLSKKDSWRVFEELLSDPEHPLPQSSLNVVFNEERHDADDVFLQREPNNFEDLAWQMSWTGDEAGHHAWMVGGKHALLELRGEEVTQPDGTRKFLGKYYVNENSFLEWYRGELDLLYDIKGPNGEIHVNNEIVLRKGGSVYNLPFASMIEGKGKNFVSEDKITSYEQTWLNLQWEANTFETLYHNDINYRIASGQGMEKWMDQYEQLTLMNPLTKTGFRTNMLQRLLTGTMDYEEGRANFDQGKYLSDNKLGGAFTEMVLAFYNLGDFKELQRVLGADSEFFTREGWLKAAKSVIEATKKRPGGGLVWDPQTAKNFEKAFEGSNRISANSSKEQQQAFVDFINLCTTNLPGAYSELLLQHAITNSVSKRFNLEDRKGLSLTSAEAYFFTRFMGGFARNDIGANEKGPSPSVHDKLSEIINMGWNRLKYAQGEGKPSGNPQTLNKHLAAAILPMLGVVTQQEVNVVDENGDIVYADEKRTKPLMRRLSVLQIIEELHNLRVRQYERAKQMKHAGYSDQQITAANKLQNRKYMDVVARDAAFRENAHREYVQVHLRPGYNWMKRIMESKGINLSEYHQYDPWGGITVNKEKFSKDIQKDLLGVIRDMTRKYKWHNMNEDIRMAFYNPKTQKMEFRNAKLAQQLFGYDVLNCEEFWERDRSGRPIKRYGFHGIDFNKVEANRHQLMKQVFMTEIAAELYSHQINNSGDVRYNQAYYLNFIDALDIIPGQVVIDELAKHGIDVRKGLLTKKDKEWLKARALNGRILWWDAGPFGFHLKWWITSLWDKTDKDGLGFGKMFSIIAKEAFAGGPTA